MLIREIKPSSKSNISEPSRPCVGWSLLDEIGQALEQLPQLLDMRRELMWRIKYAWLRFTVLALRREHGSIELEQPFCEITIRRRGEEKVEVVAVIDLLRRRFELMPCRIRQALKRRQLLVRTVGVDGHGEV